MTYVQKESQANQTISSENEIKKGHLWHYHTFQKRRGPMNNYRKIISYRQD